MGRSPGHKTGVPSLDRSRNVRRHISTSNVGLSSERSAEGRLSSLCDRQWNGSGTGARQFRVLIARVSRGAGCQDPIVAIFHAFHVERLMIGFQRGFSPLLPPHSFIDSGSLCLSPQPSSALLAEFPVSCPPTGWEKSALRRPADGRIGAMQDVCRPAIQRARHGPSCRARSRRRAIPLPSTHSRSLHAEPAPLYGCTTHGAVSHPSPLVFRTQRSGATTMEGPSPHHEIAQGEQGGQENAEVARGGRMEVLSMAFHG
jgi:hypothetical protein